MYERLPAPFGLVRYGVAPDHPEVKSVIHKFESVAEDPRVRLLCNVDIGKDVTLHDLRRHYHAMVLCYGAGGERKLSVPGSDLPQCYSGRDFVAWYSAHPDYADVTYDFSNIKSVAVIGNGNVALDIARILATPTEVLAKTDISSRAIAVLERSAIKDIHIIGRRGPVQAAFTNKELREIISIPGCNVNIPAEFLELDPISAQEAKEKRPVKRRLSLLATGQQAEKSSTASKTLHFHFCRSPTRLLAKEGCPNQLGALELECNDLTTTTQSTGATDTVSAADLRTRGTGRYELLPCDALFYSIGYRGRPMAGLPFDDVSGTMPNRLGRVCESAQAALSSTGDALPGVYVSGWLKRGPSGIIGTNKWDSEETANSIVEDLLSGGAMMTPPAAEVQLDSEQDAEAKAGFDGIALGLSTEVKRKIVTFDEFKRIERKEIADGEQHGKVAEKIHTTEDMVRVAHQDV
mmetsp:Transcript_6999/g.21315  ORF Transcript_6999/g.21315 Transcript_6999/m.21315 type:complete len:463 (+) Transcript_6999:1727-3115(+)